MTPSQDPAVRREAAGILDGLFQGMGNARKEEDASVLGGLGGDLQEFLTMPLELAEIFVGMSAQMAELVLKSLAEAGFVLVRGLMPA